MPSKSIAPSREQRPDDGERLLEARDAVVERGAEGRELHVVPARAEPQDEPAAGDLVDRGRLLREHERRVERGRGDQRSQRDPIGGLGEGRQGRPRLPWSAALAARVPVQQVVAHPDRVEAHLLRQPCDRAQLRPADLALDLGELDADADRPAGGAGDGAPGTGGRSRSDIVPRYPIGPPAAD